MFFEIINQYYCIIFLLNWSEHSDSSFVYGFMILDYGFGTMTATTFFRDYHTITFSLSPSLFMNILIRIKVDFLTFLDFHDYLLRSTFHGNLLV